MHWKVDRLNIPLMLKCQKMALLEKLKEESTFHIVFLEIDVPGKKGVWIEIRIDVGMLRCFVGLKKGNEISHFVRQVWMHEAMGFTAGCNYPSCSKVKYQRKVR